MHSVIWPLLVRYSLSERPIALHAVAAVARQCRACVALDTQTARKSTQARARSAPIAPVVWRAHYGSGFLMPDSKVQPTPVDEGDGGHAQCRAEIECIARQGGVGDRVGRNGSAAGQGATTGEPMLHDSASAPAKPKEQVLDEQCPQSKEILSFGPFRLFATERLLEKDGVALNVGSRALDLLIALIERAPEVVSKRELMERVWSNLLVDEGSLRFQIASLRKVLGDGQSGVRYVTNVVGRGYCFAAQIRRSAVKPPIVESFVADRATKLPTRLLRMVGRDETIQTISRQLLCQRFVTVVGPGGMGKTTVAISVAHTNFAEFGGAVHFVDLGALNDSSLVPSALASTLGLPVNSDDPIQSVLSFVRNQRMLLVLDSCEHVIETAAALAESIFREASQVHILATSREPLRVEGEQVSRLPPLGYPPAAPGLKAAEVMSFPAVRLFVERVTASGHPFVLSDADAPIVADLCRRLDGMALALELAASRVAALGIRGTAALLDSQFRLLWQGRRTALPRHQTLGATLDWSHSLLSEFERVVLRRLAVFVGTFSLEAAQAIAADNPDDCGRVAESVASLVAKSLVAAEITATAVRYRLLDTMRAYVQGKLLRSGEATAVALRHATYHRELLEGTDSAASQLSNHTVPGVHREYVSNVRAALEWSFSPQGDLDLGTALAAASAPLFLEMSLLSECRVWMERSIAARDAAAWDAHREMEIQAALALSLMFTKGDCEEVRVALSRGLALAEELRYPRLQLRLLSARHVSLTRSGDFHGALALAQRGEAVVKMIPDPAAAVMADWMLGISYHFIGSQCRARELCETVLHPLPSRHGNVTHVSTLHRRSRGAASIALARALWLQGHADRAVKVARQTLDEADTLGHPVMLCNYLIYAVSVFLWIGDWPAAEALIERLIAHAERHSLAPFHAVGVGSKGELSLRRGDVDAGIRLLRTCVETLNADPVFAGDLAEGLAMAGQFDEAMAVIDEAIAHVERNGESFHTPEILRIKGELLASVPGANLCEAEDWLSRSLELAHRQSALAWELRATTTLALLRRKQDRHGEAHGALAAVYDRFTEGFQTSDLRAARRLLDELEQPASAARTHATSIPKHAQG
jgi:predicted ATPase/DNA-binding winged helix-turn-helix (wHTH) protein